MIAHKLKTIFIHITKTAGSSIEVALNAVEESNKGAVDPMTGEFVDVVTGEEKHMSALECQAFVGDSVWDDYFKFSVVRNPFDRFHSLWWNGRYVGKKHEMSFREFTSFALHTSLRSRLQNLRHGRWKVHKRFWPQTRWLESRNGKIEMDQVLRFESISADFAILSQKLQLPSEELPKILVKNRSPKSRRNYSEDYTDAIREIVADHYRSDLEAFNYDFK